MLNGRPFKGGGGFLKLIEVGPVGLSTATDAEVAADAKNGRLQRAIKPED